MAWQSECQSGCQSEWPFDLTAVSGWLNEHQASMVDDLRAFVEIESPSDDTRSLGTAARWLEEWIVERVGPLASRRCQRSTGFGDTLVLTWTGSTGSPTPTNETGAVVAPKIVALGHYDTVWPLGTLKELPFRVDGDVLRGPGVFDMKTGIVQFAWAVRALDTLGVPRPEVTIVLNGDEEIGSPSSRQTIEDVCADSSIVLVFEPSEHGGLKTARKGVGFFDLAVHGVEAHAGLDPSAGASAITEMAYLILEIVGLNDPGRGTSVNVGTLTGGTRKNVVAGAALAGIDVRIETPEEADRIDEALTRLHPHDDRVRLDLSGGWNRPPMVRTETTAALFSLARQVGESIGLDLHEVAVGGGSDGNFAAALGCPVLDGLGAVGGGAHARNEHASVSAMPQRAALAAGFLAALADPKVATTFDLAHSIWPIRFGTET
jgi:glutamate carboxypeptidase